MNGKPKIPKTSTMQNMPKLTRQRTTKGRMVSGFEVDFMKISYKRDGLILMAFILESNLYFCL